MAAKGTEAKDILRDSLAKLMGDNFVGVFDKKIYVNVKESSGEVVQLALSVTCPKNTIGNLESESSHSSPTGEITKEDEQTVEELLKELGL